MRSVLILSLSLVLAMLCAGHTQAVLIAHYPLSGNADDISGSANHAIPSAGATYVDDPVRGACLYSTDYNVTATVFVETPFHNGLEVSTFALWFYCDETGISSHTLFSNHLGFDNAGNLLVRYFAHTGQFSVLCIDGWADRPVSPQGFEPLRWYHVALVNDASLHQLYIDGVLVDTYVGSAITDERPLVIGSSYAGSGGMESGFKGRLSDFRVYNEVLGSNKIAEIALGQVDSDGDGRHDAREMAQGTDLYDPNSFLGIPDIERAALVDFYHTTHGDGWTDNSGWKTPPLYGDGFAMPGTEPNWYGVACYSKRVGIVGIGGSVGGDDGVGSDSPYVGFPDTVERIWAYVNHLEGPIPTSLQNLPNLHHLIMNGNQLSGPIPPELGNIPKLDTLGLGSNQLTGPIPPALGNLAQLETLQLHQNLLTSVPPELGNLTNLEFLDLSNTHLVTIPSALGNLANLSTLYLYRNQLISIPPELGNLTRLTSLYLYDNQITGSIPSALGHLENLRVLLLGNNWLSGSIPTSLGSLNHLTNLALYGNQLSGAIPPELGNLMELTSLSLGGNQLSGTIPSVLGNLTQLTSLSLTDNSFSGAIPPELGNLTNLTSLALSGNQLSGTIPSALTNLTRVAYFYVQDNQITDIAARFAAGSTLYVGDNPLSYDAIYNQIPALQADGVIVSFTNRVPTTLAIVSGDNQIGEANTVLPEPLVVQVEDQARVPFAGVPVTFTVAEGDAWLHVGSTTTDADGLAQSVLSLGAELGATVVEVVAADISESVRFHVIETVDFPDENLEAVVRASLAIPSRPLTTLDLESLTRLDAYSKGIANLAGLEHCGNLESARLGGNQITDLLPLGGLSALTVLELYRNPINDISALAGLVNLQTLYLGDGQLSDIGPLAGLVKLRRLSLNGNQIADVTPLAEMTELEDLKGWSNQISDIRPLAELTSLVNLELQGNQISDVTPLGRLVNLEWLNLGSNQISDATPLAGLSKLKSLDLQRNRIASLGSLAGWSRLESLYLNVNQLTDIGSLAQAGLSHLKYLDISGNQLHEVHALAALTGLQQLYASYNRLSDITPLAGLVGLQRVGLPGNDIEDTAPFAGLTQLQWVDMDSNEIRDMQPFLNNPGMGSGDSVAVRGNPLSYRTIGTQIPVLQSRNVTVGFSLRTPTTLTMVSGNNQSGTVSSLLPAPLVVAVRDQKNEPFEGVPVTFTVTEGGGSLNPIETETAVDGQAESSLLLGPTAGANRVQVIAAQIATPVLFTAVATGNHTPAVDAGGPYTVDEGGSVTLTAIGQDPGDTLTYAWDLDEDGTFETAGQTAVFPASALDGPDIRTVQVQVTDTGGLTATDEAAIQVLNVAPIANVASDAPQAEGTAVTMTVSPTDPGVSDTFAYSFDWDDDGTYEIVGQSNPSASHIWSDDGTYTVGVRVQDDDGGVGTARLDVVVTDLSPVASFAWAPESQEEGAPVQFTDASLSSPDAVVSWAWILGDGSTSNAQHPSHSYADDGIYTVVLTVTDEDGSVDSATYTVTIRNVMPMVIVGADASLDEGGTLVGPGSFNDPGEDTWTATIDYGDQTGEQSLMLASDQTFLLSHLYADDGSYTVVLTIADEDGGVGHGTMKVTVSNVPPVVLLHGTDTVAEGIEYTLTLGSVTDPGADTVTQYLVDWGDDIIDLLTTAGDLSHTYSDGTQDYPITVSLVDEDGTHAQAGSKILTVLNIPPVALADSYDVSEDGVLVVSAPGVLGNDTDVAADALTAHLMGAMPTHYGTLSLKEDGGFTYTPQADYYGEDSFSYLADDGDGGSASTTVSLQVLPVNDAPVAHSASVATDEDVPLDIRLGAMDVDGDPLSYRITEAPRYGSLTGVAPDLRYLPALDYHGTDTFTFVANDGTLDSETATVDITLRSVNDAPVANAGPDQTVEGTCPEGAWVLMDGAGSGDTEGDALRFLWTWEGGTASGTEPTPTLLLPLGRTTVTLTVSDGFLEDIDTVEVTVTDTTAPKIDLLGDNPLTLVRFGAPYQEPGAEVTDLCDANPHLTLSGTVTINRPGSYPITYEASDASGNEAQVTRTVNVIDDPSALSHPYLVLGSNKAVLDKSVHAEGDIHSNNTVDIKKGPSTHIGDVTAVGRVSIDKEVTIEGDVTSGDDIKCAKDVIIIGTVREFTPVPAQPLTILSFSAGNNDVKVKKGETAPLAPGSYGKVEVEENSLLQLSSGVYFLEELKLKKGVGVAMDLSTGPVVVNVVRSIDFGQDVRVSLSPLGEVDSRYVTFNTLADIQVGQGGLVLGSLNAPEGKVHLKQGVRLGGSIGGEEVNVDADTVLIHHDISERWSSVLAAPMVAGVGVSNQRAEREEPLSLLLPNFPNPFNPETWMPYQLGMDTDVVIRIHNAAGQPVRTLSLGHQTAGNHVSRDEAAYWDGCNDAGEQVAAGIYFYTMFADDFTTTKRMWILK